MQVSPQEDQEKPITWGKFKLILIQNDEKEFSLKGGSFAFQNLSNSGFGS